MDYLIAAMIGIGAIAAVLAYVRSFMTNKLYSDLFFILTLLTLVGGMVILSNAGSLTVNDLSYQSTDPVTNITMTNLTTTYSLPDSMLQINTGFIVLLGGVTVFMLFMLMWSYIQEFIENLGSTAKLKRNRHMSEQIRSD